MRRRRQRIPAWRRRLARRAAEWARRRQGPDGTAVRLARRRIYILPTRFGIALAVLIFAMLLGSMNYGTSLGFALTFLLASLGLVVLHHCHNNLLRAEIRFVGAPPVFAGGEASFQIGVGNDTALPRYEIELGVPEREPTRPVDVEAGGFAVLSVTVPAPRRGWLPLPRFSVSTRHPGNLCRAWTWLHMDARCLVYPAPAPPGRPVPPAASRNDAGSADGREGGNADFIGLRAATPSDSPKHMAWKAYARNDQLLVKQFAGAEERAEIFAWDSLPGLDAERRLAQLARWCLDAHGAGRRFGLRLPGRVVGLGSGEHHLHECLAALALFDEPKPELGASTAEAAA
ncbi:MAG TPA: DUF58 domain-containing protein [Gammaproteobacteria bacterium]|nr:DUF58 domain-containing protein [Gammaproteobacteria bacterium]